MLQVYKSHSGSERLKDFKVQDQTCIGRDADCNIVLQWDGISRRHAHFEAREHCNPKSTQATTHAEKVDKAHGVLWYIVGAGGNGTFLNSIRLRNGGKQRVRDGDVLSFGKGRDVKEGGAIEEKELVYMFVFRESRGDGVAHHPPSSSCRARRPRSEPGPSTPRDRSAGVAGSTDRRRRLPARDSRRCAGAGGARHVKFDAAPTAGALNRGRDADPHEVPAAGIPGAARVRRIVLGRRAVASALASAGRAVPLRLPVTPSSPVKPRRRG